MRAMTIDDELIEKAFTAAVAQNRAERNRIEIERQRNGRS